MPLYIRWGRIIGNKSQIPNPPLLSAMGLIPDLAEQMYLRTIPGSVQFSPWASSIKEHPNPGEMTFRSLRDDKPFCSTPDAPADEPEPEPAPGPAKPFPPVEKYSGQRSGETMTSFLARRAGAREKAMASENEQQKQRREQREANASTGAARRVYVWELRDGHYIRTAAGRDKYEDVWESYSESQRIYDWNTNEWDVCGAFGTNEDEQDLRPYTVIDFDNEEDDAPYAPLMMGPDTMESDMLPRLVDAH
ncbi:hypothetical protein MSAN_00116500 [Mycena sanguinolenta]|uniref:Uncharacterized protein n=1 Tax=Mycena sanguinolenta TaxID=230812 RepID=A0A8H6ZIL7_9AGAR|nr:hypothetical protein MSAN_00116500 [Mycena sanguinolenta]